MKKSSVTKSEKVARYMYLIVFLSFVIPIVYLIFRIVFYSHFPVKEDGRSIADYSLMLVQCALGVVIIHLPTLLEKRFQFELPTVLYLMYIIFLYCAIFLGEIGEFYYLVPHWDMILHGFSSIMAGAFGFIVVALLNRNNHIAMNLSPLFVALFAFCFAMTLGVLWEVYEFTFDGILGLNMQKFKTHDGMVLVGHEAIVDTMKDIIVDGIGALCASVAGYASLKKGRGWASDAIIRYTERKTAE